MLSHPRHLQQRAWFSEAGAMEALQNLQVKNERSVTFASLMPHAMLHSQLTLYMAQRTAAAIVSYECVCSFRALRKRSTPQMSS